MKEQDLQLSNLFVQGPERIPEILDFKRLNKYSLNYWLEQIDEPNKSSIDKFLEYGNNTEILSLAPGSRRAHQAWPGGYKEHLRQTMMIVAVGYKLFTDIGAFQPLPEQERFTLSDALTVMFLHDIEKPFMYSFQNGQIVNIARLNKRTRKDFRQEIISKFGFTITPTMDNALRFVEGVRDEDYRPGARVDQPLAALCHAADNISARALYDLNS